MKFLIDQKIQVDIIVNDRENIVSKLLQSYNFEYQRISFYEKNIFEKSIGIAKRAQQLYSFVKNKKNVIVTGQASIPLAISSINKYCDYIAFTDSEPTPWNFLPAILRSKCIFTPAGFKLNLGWKHIRIESYKELAYLHPNHFSPNEDIFNYIDISKEDIFIVFRFNAFDAAHDIRRRGLTLEQKISIIKNLSKDYRVFISSESPLPSSLQQYKINIPENMMHDLLFFSSLLIADTQTSVVEAGCLGTPAIRCNSFVGSNDMGNVIEMEKRFKLISNISDANRIIPLAREILENSNTHSIWKERVSKLLSVKVDLSSFFIWFFSNYPNSLEEVFKSNKYDRIITEV